MKRRKFLSPEQNFEMAECALSLAEAGVFGKRQLERIRGILRKLSSSEEVETLWKRVHTLEVGGYQLVPADGLRAARSA